MKESKRKTGKPKRAYSVPGILRKSLSIGLRFVSLCICQNITMFICKDERISHFKNYIDK